MEPAIEMAERGYLVPTVVQQKWAAPVDELQGHAGLCPGLFALGTRADRWASCSSSRRQPVRCGPLPPPVARLSTEARLRRPWPRFRSRTAAASPWPTLPAYRPEWVTPISQNYRGYTLHEIPPNGQGIAALIALGILSQFDLASLPVDGPIRSTCRSRP
jgi:gamma-glutamyltranspeptidase/glutathione hydrolase